MSMHQQQWLKLQTAVQSARIPQALLFVGPLHCALDQFTLRLTQLIHCTNKHPDPCLSCLDCRMCLSFEHPDTQWIKPEKNGGAVKIDQIRELQNSAYLTPQRSVFRVIVIEAAERMNTASANALLKVLEEPAPNTLFVLMAQQLSTVLPTVLSRCQIVRFSTPDESVTNLLQLGEKHLEGSDRATIMQQAEPILEGLIALMNGKQHPCNLASQWSSYELDVMLWFLYLVFAQLQYANIVPLEANTPAFRQLNQLSNLLSPLIIFTQIDKITALFRKISHNMNVNQNLALEDLLFSLVK